MTRMQRGHRHRRATIGARVVAALLIAATAYSVSASPVTGPRDALRGFVVVGSEREPRACLGVWIAPAFVVAPAHCVAQMLAPAEFVAFGFRPVLASRDVNGSAEHVGAFKQTTRASIARIAYHQQYANGSETTTAVSTGNDSDDTTTRSSASAAFDWAVLTLQEPQALSSSTPLLLAADGFRFTRERSSESIGTLRVNRQTLDVHFVNDTLVVDSDRCRVHPSAAQQLVCAVPRRPEARLAVANRTNSTDSRAHWSVLVAIRTLHDFSEFLLGFGTTDAQTTPLETFTLAGETAKAFIAAATDDANLFRAPRVVDGTVVTLTPELAFITGVRATRAGRNVCGGSLVSATVVLTAAHCVESLDAPLWVSVGSAFSSGDATGEQILVARVARHPLYDRDAMRFDVALLELKYASIQKPVALARSSARSRLSRTARVFGYGATSGRDPLSLSLVLQSAPMDIVASNLECTRTLLTPIDDSMLCAVGKGDADACAGDSGGPLVVSSSRGTNALVGVVSFGRSCGTGLPGVYADVAQSLAFIESVIGPKSGGDPVDTQAPTQAPGRAPSPSPLPSLTVSPAPAGTLIPRTTEAPVVPPTSAQPLSPALSSQPPWSALVSDASKTNNSSSYQLQVQSDTPPTVRESLVRFLTGDLSNVIASERMTRLFRGKALVFVSSASLDGLERVLAAYSAKALHRRTKRFGSVGDDKAAKTTAEQHRVC